jgi:hypothetical protein
VIDVILRRRREATASKDGRSALGLVILRGSQELAPQDDDIRSASMPSVIAGLDPAIHLLRKVLISTR